MKRSECKKKVKPIIQECIKEMLYEEGFLSSLISEVIKGTGGVIREAKSVPTSTAPPPASRKTETQEIKKKAAESRKKLLEAIGKDAFNGVNIFEGTTPMTSGQAQGQPASNPLANVAPSDPGVDISSIPGANVWRHLVKE